MESVNISISPSGRKAIYLVRLEPTSTPPPGPVDGEIWLGGGPAEVWLWDEGSSRSIGKIEHCATYYQWSSDEQIIVVTPLGFLSHCGDIFVWIIDLVKGQITPILGGTSTIVPMYGISPNGKYLLYNLDQQLYFMDLETFETKMVSTKGINFADSQWFDDKSLLVMYQITGKLKKIGRLDLESGDIIDLLTSNNLPEITRQIPNFIRLSPDHKQLAISLRDTRDIEHSLWVIKVDGPLDSP
jgi:Tol biopolymer transport system component